MLKKMNIFCEKLPWKLERKRKKEMRKSCNLSPQILMNMKQAETGALTNNLGSAANLRA